MSYRIHTASGTEVYGTYVQAFDGYIGGYEHQHDEAANEIVVLIDRGNQEAWVIDDAEALYNDLGKILEKEKPATLDEFRDRGDQPGEVWKLTGRDSVHTAVQAEKVAGICGDRSPAWGFGDLDEERVHTLCNLQHGHEGWHAGDDGSSWSPVM